VETRQNKSVRGVCLNRDDPATAATQSIRHKVSPRSMISFPASRFPGTRCRLLSRSMCAGCTECIPSRRQFFCPCLPSPGGPNKSTSSRATLLFHGPRFPRHVINSGVRASVLTSLCSTEVSRRHVSQLSFERGMPLLFTLQSSAGSVLASAKDFAAFIECYRALFQIDRGRFRPSAFRFTTAHHFFICSFRWFW